MSNDATLLACAGIERRYTDGNVHALRGVSLDIASGESVAITGPSGCGKSTLLQILGGLDQPTAGSVAFAGRPLRSWNLDTYRSRYLGFVFQSFHLLPNLNAVENVQIPMFEAAWPRRERSRRAERLLAEVGLADRRQHLPSKLSVGERQRVAIARALANEPQLLLADEPTGNLDSRNQAEVLALLHKLRSERGLTLVMVTHSGEVASSCDRVIRMLDGRVIEPAREV